MTPFGRPAAAARARSTLLLLLLLALPCAALPAPAQEAAETDETLATPDYRDWDGRRIMAEVFRRHEQYPYVFERQSMVLTDAAGEREVRRLRRYSRLEEDGTFRYLLVFDHPPEVRGTALLALRRPDGNGETGIYLPAFGPVLKHGTMERRGSRFLGTDFTIGDLAAEPPEEYDYRRQADLRRGELKLFVIEARPASAEVERRSGYGLRRHYIRQDNFYIVRTDYFDRRLRFLKRQTRHDLKRVDGEMWRADMVLMENPREQHSTLIKIDRRVFSHDYVPPELFTPDYLFANRHVLGGRGGRHASAKAITAGAEVTGDGGQAGDAPAAVPQTGGE